MSLVKICTYYDDNNTIIDQEYYRLDDKLHGICKSYYYNGMIKGVSIYNNGECLERTEYYSTGELRETHKTIDDITKEYITYYKNKQIWTTYLSINGRFNGINKTFYDNGNLQKLCMYKDGRLHGVCEKYYLDGESVKTRIVYENGNEISSINYPCSCDCHIPP